jgi:hypothetical protein
MRDFYRRLNLEPEADRKELRAALMGVSDRELRNDGAAILLDERRRPTYDRNRQLLANIGTLRSHLGLYLAPFWARGSFEDFTYGDPPRTPCQRINDLIVTQALAPSKRRRHRRFRIRNWETPAAIAGGIIALTCLVGLIYLVTRVQM